MCTFINQVLDNKLFSPLIKAKSFELQNASLVAHTSPFQYVMLHQECYLLIICGKHEYQATNTERADCRNCTHSAHGEGSVATKEIIEMVSSTNPSDHSSIIKTNRRANLIWIGLCLFVLSIG